MSAAATPNAGAARFADRGCQTRERRPHWACRREPRQAPATGCRRSRSETTGPRSRFDHRTTRQQNKRPPGIPGQGEGEQPQTESNEQGATHLERQELSGRMARIAGAGYWSGQGHPGPMCRHESTYGSRPIASDRAPRMTASMSALLPARNLGQSTEDENPRGQPHGQAREGAVPGFGRESGASE